MDIEQLKSQADKYQRTAQGILVRDGYLSPMLYAISEDRVVPVGVHNETKEDKDEISDILDTVKDTCEAIALTMTMHYIDFKEDNPDVPEDITKDSRCSRALFCYLYTKEVSLQRLWQFAIGKEDKIAFIEHKWQKVDDLSGEFCNPYKKS